MGDVVVAGAPTASRSDLQIGRRLFHLTNGVVVATAYALLFTHAQVVHLFGTVACLVYILDRVRIHYPELLRRAPWVNEKFFRAEEQVKEAAMTPYAISILLTMITFPKPVALIAIYTLAIADPLSAVVGITWGKRRIAPGRTLEGSLAFFAGAAAVTSAVLAWATPVPGPLSVRVQTTALVALLAAAFEAVPLRLDDNLTIPLAVGFIAWLACALFGVVV
ncbi:MAG TPA: SEC59/DGK1/VTE5 family protein [Candidatus Binatia bacterium]|nr:SEC59/DGK1/VTE5 family protein [Candidatus Binatia bacterium]